MRELIFSLRIGYLLFYDVFRETDQSYYFSCYGQPEIPFIETKDTHRGKLFQILQELVEQHQDKQFFIKPREGNEWITIS